MTSFISDRLRESLLWFSGKPVISQLSMISLIQHPDDLAIIGGVPPINLLSTEEKSSLKDIEKGLMDLLASGKHSEEDIVDSLMEIGLNRMVALILLGSVKDSLLLLIRMKNVMSLSPDRLKEYVEEAIYYYMTDPFVSAIIRAVTSLARWCKLSEISTIVLFVLYSLDSIGSGRTTFEKLKDDLHKEGLREDQINALLTPMKERFEEIRQAREEHWERLRKR